MAWRQFFPVAAIEQDGGMPSRLDAKVTTRWMRRADLPMVLRMESAAFDFPWTAEDFGWSNEKWVRRLILVDGAIAGYWVYELRPRAIELLNLAVDERWRRHGLGRRMLAGLQRHVATGLVRRNRVTATVHERNLSACQFLRACGFLAVRAKRGYFAEPSLAEDLAIRFRWSPGDCPSNDARRSSLMD